MKNKHLNFNMYMENSRNFPYTYLIKPIKVYMLVKNI